MIEYIGITEREILFWRVAIPSAFAIASGYAYSRAILRGIASARDEQHRISPENPWVYFDREFKPQAQRMAWILVLWLLLGTAALYRHDSTMLSLHWSTPMESAITFAAQFLGLLGMTALILTGITLFAPRFKNPILPSAIGAIIAIPLWTKICWVDIDRADQGGAQFGMFCYGLLGCYFFFLAWLYVRRRLDRVWFRFDE